MMGHTNLTVFNVENILENSHLEVNHKNPKHMKSFGSIKFTNRSMEMGKNFYVYHCVTDISSPVNWCGPM